MASRSLAGNPVNSWQDRNVAAMAALRRGERSGGTTTTKSETPPRVAQKRETSKRWRGLSDDDSLNVGRELAHGWPVVFAPKSRPTLRRNRRSPLLHSRRNNVCHEPSPRRSGRTAKPSACNFSINGDGRNGVVSNKLSPEPNAATAFMTFGKGSSPEARIGRMSSVRGFRDSVGCAMVARATEQTHFAASATAFAASEMSPRRPAC